jgi:proteasome lid subunit RPN8/RPN11
LINIIVVKGFNITAGSTIAGTFGVEAIGNIDWSSVDALRGFKPNYMDLGGESNFNLSSLFTSTENFFQDGDNLPTREKGAFIDDFDNFYNFMLDQARNNPVEVAAFGVRDGNRTRYFVQRWNENTATRSVNYHNAIPGYTREDIVSQYHTHPQSSGPSWDDAYVSQRYNVPVYTIGANGKMWMVHYPPHLAIPNYIHIPYGKIVKW